ncbi:MAG TPA: GrpB family protein [Actinomycetes bacterium]|nr:GrpB family protein [Actinomycetes bacterium]
MRIGSGELTGRDKAMRPARIIEHYERVPVVVRRPDPTAPVVARRLLHLLAAAVPDLRAEHVGSSAVPGLAGKGTIDLLLPTPPERIPAVTEALVDLGFQRQAIPQAFPPTRPMLQGVLRHGDRPYRIHLHIVPASSREVRELRGFRDALRADTRLRRDYEKLKHDIVARGLTDSVQFTEAKQTFIVAALRRLGLRPADSDG